MRSDFESHLGLFLCVSLDYESLYFSFLIFKVGMLTVPMLTKVAMRVRNEVGTAGEG